MFTFEEVIKLSFYMKPQVYGDPIDIGYFMQLDRAITTSDEALVRALLKSRFVRCSHEQEIVLGKKYL